MEHQRNATIGIETFGGAHRENVMVQARNDVWKALADTADLARRLKDMPPCNRATAARKTILQSCLAIRRYFANDPRSMHEALRNAQLTMLFLRKLRETEHPTMH